MTGPVIPGLTARDRHPEWVAQYGSEFWLPWHMSLQGHDKVPDERPVSSMQELDTENGASTSAARHLLSFEGRTRLLHLPSETAVTSTLIVDLANEILEAENAPEDYWQRLDEHFKKHVRDGDSGPYLQAASRASTAHLEEVSGLAPEDLRRLDPGTVRNPHEYAVLAWNLLLSAVEASRPFGFFLYCPHVQRRDDPRPATGLSLNIRVPAPFLEPFMESGRGEARDIHLGIFLAGCQEVQAGGGVYVPKLVPQQGFTTLHAPDKRISSKISQGGRTCHLSVS